jgi:hypothetical protein
MVNKLGKKWVYGLAALAAIAVAGSGVWVLVGTRDVGPEIAFTPGEPVVRRLSAEQYANSISDIFGESIRLGGRFEPGLRVEGLLETGSSVVGISSFGMQQYDTMARVIADQVLDEERRGIYLNCEPDSATAPDDVCARQFLSDVGLRLFRRPLTGDETNAFVKAARVATEVLDDFYAGTAMALAGMLTSPQFLFRHETLEPDPSNDGGYRVDAYSKASRLSFFLWNSTPDPLLLAAAEAGELDSSEGLTRQVERMIASPRIENGIRAFFYDMLEFDKFDDLTKDTLIYPKWSARVGDDAKEMTLRTIVHLLLTEQADYRDLFTTKKTFLTPTLASIYQVPLLHNVPNGSPNRWYPYEFPADDPRSGLLMHTSFLTLHSHEGRGSPTLRGSALRELLMCQEIPAPPPDVEFDTLQNTDNEIHRTARDRLDAHNEVASCVGCHKIMDPMGLALENFDSSGAWRLRENGVLIDTSGELDGVFFADGGELGEVVRENPAITECVVERVASYALGRTPVRGERQWIDQVVGVAFADSGYRLPQLIKALATDELFYRATPPEQPVDMGARELAQR